MIENEFKLEDIDIIESLEEDIDLSESEYEIQSRIPQFPPGFKPGTGFPSGGMNPPSGGPNQPFTPQNIKSPPKGSPKKSDSQVKSFKNVSPNSIRFCLYKYTYIWERRGRNYWAFLTYVDNRTVAGFRWFRFRWVYFGIDIRRIDSFVCYRQDLPLSTSEESNLNANDSFILDKKEISNNYIKDVYSRMISESTEDEDSSITTLEVAIPSVVDDFNKNLILNYADNISKKYFSSENRENIELSLNELLKEFQQEFELKTENLQIPKNQKQNIRCSINLIYL